MKSLLFLLPTLLTLLTPTPTAAHMQLTYPPPLKSKFNPHTSPANIDYSLTSPLKGDGSDFPCKGSLALLSSSSSADGASVATWSGGNTYNFTVSGGAPHGGGSCQAALSVDGGKTFRVVHSYEGACPGDGPESSFAFVVPADVPGAKGAVFAWTWFNRLGNREMYMNCAVVDLVGGGGGRAKVAFAQRPALFVANVGNGCRTVDSADVKFPNPGPDVDAKGGTTPPAGSSCGSVVAGNGGGETGGSEGGDTSGETTTLAPVLSTPTQAASYSSSTGCRTAKTCKPTPTSDPGKGYTPGNDWPDWFQSAAPQTTRNGLLLTVSLSIFTLVHYLF